MVPEVSAPITTGQPRQLFREGAGPGFVGVEAPPGVGTGVHHVRSACPPFLTMRTKGHGLRTTAPVFLGIDPEAYC